MPYQSYETVIGLEVHVQLSTMSKAFCADPAGFGGEPNTHVSPISLGHPGVLPRLNAEQVEYAVRLGLALGCRINLFSAFDRKNYFYADLPKGYQITQDLYPICTGGFLDIHTSNGNKRVNIHHIHMEEDAGKSIHLSDEPYSLIDLNRAGVPLLEIVTMPDMRSAEEVEVFMAAMRRIVRYLDICDGNMEEGSMRCDCNVSVRPKGAEYYGERCEIKNLNSMRFARMAIDYEVKRQIDIVESGGKIEQQTLHFDSSTGITSPLRDKEDAHDYRYFPDPDLPPVQLTSEFIGRIKAQMPALPQEVFDKLVTQYGLPAYDAGILFEEKANAEYFEHLCRHSAHFKGVSNLIINKLLPYCQENDIKIQEFPIKKPTLAKFIELIESGSVSAAMAYQRIFPELIAQPEAEPLELAKKLDLVQTSDESYLLDLIKEAFDKYPDKVEAYRKGKKGLLGFFMGEVVKASKGKADPKVTNKMVVEALESTP